MSENLQNYLTAFENGRMDPVLESLYGPDELTAQKSRYINLLSDMKKRFSSEDVSILSTPGRTELGGNHTDHNHGRVLSAAVHLDLAAVVEPNDGMTVCLYSRGFSGPIQVDLSNLQPVPEEQGTPQSLIRGTAAGLKDSGFQIGGFNACVHGTIPPGTGLSSSAAFEILMAHAFNKLYNKDMVSEITMARIGQAAEGNFFGKPCGLMDQVACAIGGILHIDFINPTNPLIECIDSDLSNSGLQPVVVNTGGSHADLTHHYAAIPAEMKAVAAFLSKESARDLTFKELIEAVPQLRQKTGDRAVLRVMHFIEENARVQAMVGALHKGRFPDYFRLVTESGNSSWRLLQNCYAPDNHLDQGVPLALALTEKFLDGKGACRIQGGGFAGSIQAYIPTAELNQYRLFMEKFFGPGAAVPLRIRQSGITEINI